MAAPMGKMRVLELYSGIGGMHFALFASGIQFDVVLAMDINTNANLVYKHNFPTTTISSRAIESLTVQKFDSMRIDMILMSPPCQPFTRVGKQKDTEDVRTKSFLHVLDLLKKSDKPPSYILVENVKGFECSDSRMRLIQTLNGCGYNFQELLLTPLQFGIPNSRLRYFLIAKRKPLEFCFTPSAEIMEKLTGCPQDWFTYKSKAEFEAQSEEMKGQGHKCVCRRNFQMKLLADEAKTDTDSARCPDSCKRSSEDNERTLVNCKRQKQGPSHSLNTVQSRVDNCECESAFNEPNSKHEDSEFSYGNPECLQNYGKNMRQCLTDDQKHFGSCLKLYDFLEEEFQTQNFFKNYLIAEKDLKRFMVMDVVNPCSQKTCCFTKRYGHYVDGAGSLVQMTSDIQCIQEASMLKEKTIEEQNRDQWEEGEFEAVRRLKIRYFTPREIANLLCFPKSFGFPEGLSNRQLYMLLGNSLNVHIVSVLVRLMTLQD